MKLFRLLCCSVLAAMLCLPLSAGAKEKVPETMTYELEGVNRAVGSNGAVVKVTVITKKKDKVDHAALARAAVHGILFKGYQGAAQSGTVAHAALCGSPTAETTYAEFFKPFFDQGQYSGYVQCQDETRRVVKAGKEYRVSCNVVVSELQLRQDLVKAGVIKDLNSGW